MTATVETIFCKQFSPTLLTLSQQKESKFEGKVRRETVSKAEEAYFDTISPADLPSAAATRHGATPLSEANLGRRRVIPYKWHMGTVLDSYDLARMYANPEGPIAQSFAMSMGRKKDDLIIEAAFADASIGKEGAQTVAFKDESVGINGSTGGVATTLGTLAAVSTPVTMELAKMLLMMQIFNEADVDPSIPKYWAVSPKCIKAMLDLEEVGSSDYNTVKTLVNGAVDTYMGFNFFWSNRLPKDAATSTAYRTFAWAQDGIILASIGDISTEMSKRADLCNESQIYSKMDLGAVRMEGAKVHECLNVI
jgi:hypothetical protein